MVSSIWIFIPLSLLFSGLTYWSLWRGLEYKHYWTVIGCALLSVVSHIPLINWVSELQAQMNSLDPSPSAPEMATTFGPNTFMVFQPAAVLSMAFLLGAAVYVYRHRGQQDTTSKTHFTLYTVAPIPLSLLVYRGTVSLLSALPRTFDALAVSSMYVSIAVWVVLGIVSWVYYVAKTPLNQQEMSGE